MAQGADIMHADSTAPLQIAEERGLFGFGQASDMIKSAPKAQLTSMYTRRVQELIDGTWKPTNVWEGLKEGAVHMSDYTNMPEDVAKAAEDIEQKIASANSPVHRADLQAERAEAIPAGQHRRPDASGHELVHKGRRRPAAAIAAETRLVTLSLAGEGASQ